MFYSLKVVICDFFPFLLRIFFLIFVFVVVQLLCGSNRKMIVFVEVREKRIEISLGSGTQSLKWLANVVSQRLKSNGVLRKSFEEEFRTVVQFKNSKNEVLNPNESICHLVDDQEVIYADVVDSLLSAYVKTKHGIRWYSEIEAYRHLDENEGNDEENHLSSFLFVGELSGRDIDTAFKLDWQQMNWSWLGLTESDIEVRELKALLHQEYGLICRIFSHYCGVGKGNLKRFRIVIHFKISSSSSYFIVIVIVVVVLLFILIIVGEAYGMSLHEFGHFIHATGAINYRSYQRKIGLLFSLILLINDYYYYYYYNDDNDNAM